jgi:hypothetical protein
LHPLIVMRDTHLMNQRIDMVRRTRTCVSLVGALLLLAPLAGCGDDEREDDQADQRPVEGTFVGKVSGTETLVAVVAAPPAEGKDDRDATIYLSDGSEISDGFQGSIADNKLSAESEQATAEGALSGDGVKGSVELPGGESGDYQARRATGAAGLYELEVARNGTLSGASAAGVGLTSKSKLRVPGTGALKFADGKRRRFRVTAAPEGKRGPVRTGEVRLIVLPDGAMSGAGARQAGAREPEFFVKSAK